MMRHRWTILAFAVALGAAPARAETIAVTIEKMMFAPAGVTARPGDTIEWVNRDILAHTATVEFKGIRSIDYYCWFHPNMKGRFEAGRRRSAALEADPLRMITPP